MSIHGCLVLPEDVRIVPILDLDPTTRAGINASDEDYTITRWRSRTPSSVIDADSAKLVACFRTPKRIVDAVVEFAQCQGRDPRLTLDAAYPLLSRMYRMQLLVPEASALASPIDGELKAGDALLGFRLLRRVQVLNDNEVFLARSDEGRFAAVKFYRRANARIARRLVREARLLRRISGHRAPGVFGLVRAGSGFGLVTEWICGIEAQAATALLREGDGGRYESARLALCIEIAGAFADVHEDDVIHGDVHPHNVLVEADGRVRLIDFGLARDIRRPYCARTVGGVPFYLAPERAAAYRDGQSALPTLAAEQYSVAALLYEVWTGLSYLNWSLERDELLRQVTQDAPVSFQARRVAAWPELEQIIGRALEKSPDRRFPSMRCLADALQALVPVAAERDRYREQDSTFASPEMSPLDHSLQRYAITGDALRDGVHQAPVASISYGAAGIAYALLRIAQQRADPRLLATADLWAQNALALVGEPDAFYCPELKIERATVGETSLFHSISGVHCVRALVSAAQGDEASANAALVAFVEHTTRSSGRDETLAHVDLATGQAGLLLGCAELIESIPDSPALGGGRVRERGEQIADNLTAWIRSVPIESSILSSLGIAHGWAGLLFALLRWARAAGRSPDPVIKDRLQELVALSEPHGAGIHWPTHHSGSAFLENWCNGSAGHAMLFAFASRVCSEAQFGRLAERAAISAWSSMSEVGTLCCGQAGIGYALLALYRLTGDDIWLRRARIAARRAAGDRSRHFGRDALYHGAVGVVLLANDINEPARSAMPLLEPVW